MNRLIDMQVIEVGLSAVGAGIIITLVDTDNPTQRTMLHCKELVVLQWHRTPPDDAPYIIPELYWREVEVAALPELLVKLRYSFSDDVESSMLGKPRLSAEEGVWSRFDGPLVHLHLEGAVCADIVCMALEIEQA